MTGELSAQHFTAKFAQAYLHRMH